MKLFTSLVLAAFVAYVGAWSFGFIEGNYVLLLFMATAVTGIYWLAERFVFFPRRQQAVVQLEAQTAARRVELLKIGIDKVDTDIQEARDKLLKQPWWLDWTAGLFPVLVMVFILRSFLFEPFNIPSGSMIPTLQTGDLILVNKFQYGLRLPVLNTKLTEGNPVQRGDVMVFRYPSKPSVDYIKRVVGLPGDEVAYLNKKLTINGQLIESHALPEYFDSSSTRYFKQFSEKLGTKSHQLIQDSDRPAFVPGVESFPHSENCQYTVDGLRCKVPAGHYFMMGDNRDNSLDSRYWGFVPDANIVGKAFFVWMNFGNLKRIGVFD
ncbi:MAG: signal peptidase I [Rhodoferax sp.]|nr:signal peptidase I [Rhodoferax sp.]